MQLVTNSTLLFPAKRPAILQETTVKTCRKKKLFRAKNEDTAP